MVASNLDGKTRMTDSELAPRKPDNTITVVSELMMPNQVNNLGHVFGGELLSMVDRAAAVAAMRHAGGPCVTVSICLLYTSPSPRD